MKKLISIFMGIVFAASVLCGCQENPPTPSIPPSASISPTQVIQSLNPDVEPIQYATSTWQTKLETYNFNQVYNAFTDAGYTKIDTPLVSNRTQKTKVLGAGETLVTLYENETNVQIVWDVGDTSLYSLLYPNKNTNKGSVTMAQIGVEHIPDQVNNPGIGMCYVYKLSNGKAVIVDGGHNTNADNIYKTLQTLDIAKDTSGRFLIDAWILTHGHADHYGALISFASSYHGKSIISNLVYNFPIDENILPAWDCRVPSFVGYLRSFYPDSVHITPHAGLQYHFDNLTIRMLYAPEMLPNIYYTNDTSLIFIAECNGARVLQTGDAGELAAYATWYTHDTSAFDADLLQIAHHGLVTGMNNTNAWKHLGYIYNATNATYGLLPMGARDPHESRNGRYTVINAHAKLGYQTSFLVDSRESDNNWITHDQLEYNQFVTDVAAGTSPYKTLYGYDGKNIIYGETGLITYIMSTETECMATLFTLSKSGAKLVKNVLFREWIK